MGKYAVLVSVPKVAKGATGVGIRRICTRSFAVATTISANDVSGIFTWHGKNSTVSLVFNKFHHGENHLVYG